jgi:2'-5' RNA ligase
MWADRLELVNMAKIYNVATKSLNPFNVDDNRGWEVLGRAVEADEKELVPVIADCIDEIGKGLADLPFCLYNERGDEVDSTDDWQNVTGCIPDPYSFMWLTGASLVMSGQAYWYKRMNVAGFTKSLDYWAFGNVRPEILPTTTKENLMFSRVNVSDLIPAKDILYLWLPDPKVEFGPAMNYPLKRALKSAGSLSAISTFIDNYMNSGMVRSFIAQSEVPPKDDAEKKEVEDYLTKMLTGVKRALTKIRVLRNKMTITSVGGGLDELKNVGIVKEIKQDVLEAFGVPASRVWGNAANYATAANDTLVFITSEIMPLARIIQSGLNEQVFKPYGLTLQFEPRRMEEFAVVLGEKVKSLEGIASAFERAMSPAESLKAAIDLLGLDLSPQLRDRIDLSILEAQRKPEPVLPAPVVQPEQPVTEAVPEMPEPNIKALVELDKWEAKSIKAGKTVTWHPVHIPTELVEAISSGEMGWDQAREAIKGEYSTSAMIALKIPDAIRDIIKERYKFVDAETIDNLHITVCYLGDNRTLNAGDVNAMMNNFAQNQAPIMGKLQGLARFIGMESDPLVLTFDSPQMPELYTSLVGRMGLHSIPYRPEHGYIPHMTLAYIEKKKKLPIQSVEPIEIKFTEIYFVNGEDWYPFRLVGFENKSASPDILALAEAINRAADATKAAPMPQVQPSYTFNLTAQMPAPGDPVITVNVPTPQVTVNVPETSQPDVNVTVNVPEQPAPTVNVTAVPGESRLIMPQPKPVEIVRDQNGMAKEIRPK